MKKYFLSCFIFLSFSSAYQAFAFQEQSFQIQINEDIDLHLKHFISDDIDYDKKDHVVLYIQGQSDATSIAREFLLETLDRLKINIISYDVRGQGKSGGLRSHVNNFYDHVEDLSKIVIFLKKRFGYEHIHFVTHSTGGLIASLFSSHQKQLLSDQSSLTLIAPYFALAGSQLRRAGIDALSYVLSLTPARYWKIPTKKGKRAYISETGKMNNFTSDMENFEKFRYHPDKSGRPTTGWLQAAHEGQRIIANVASELEIPVLMFTTEDDQVVNSHEAEIYYYRWNRNSPHSKHIQFESPNQHGLIYEKDDTRLAMIETIKNFTEKVAGSKGELVFDIGLDIDALHEVSYEGSVQGFISEIDESEASDLPSLEEASQYSEQGMGANGALINLKDLEIPVVKRKRSLMSTAVYPAILVGIPLATVCILSKRKK